jgi:hypothetical protein
MALGLESQGMWPVTKWRSPQSEWRPVIPVSVAVVQTC